MSETGLPELDEIREIIVSELPRGHRLRSLDLTFGALIEGQDPAFLVLIDLHEEPDADPGYGMVYNMTKRIRERWSRDDLYVKVRSEGPGN